MTFADFDAILEEILASLPDDIRALLDEVALLVEDEPSREALASLGIRLEPGEPADLCGMHWGTPLTERSVSESWIYPDQVFLYRGPIQRLAGPSRRELRRQIRVTLLHELGHHFGLSEERLDELGYG